MTSLAQKLRDAANRPAVEDVEWIIGSPTRKAKRQEVIVAPGPLTRIETYESKTRGLQAIFCSTSTWTSHIVFDAENMQGCTYTVFEWHKGFSEMTAQLLPRTAYGSAFTLEKAVHKLAFSKSKTLGVDQKVYGFVFDLNSDSVVCQVAVVTRPSEPGWLSWALFVNILLCLVSLTIWIFAATKVAAANKKRKLAAGPT